MLAHYAEVAHTESLLHKLLEPARVLDPTDGDEIEWRVVASFIEAPLAQVRRGFRVPGEARETRPTSWRTQSAW